MTVEQMALTIRHGSGICLCITEDRRKQLDLPMMVENAHQRLRHRFYRDH